MEASANRYDVGADLNPPFLRTRTARLHTHRRHARASFAFAYDTLVLRLRLTPEFLQLQRQRHLLRNTEIYYGSQVPFAITSDSSGVDAAVLASLPRSRRSGRME